VSQADLILHNGSIYTMDPRQPVVHAVAIQGNRILGTGRAGAVSAEFGEAAKKVDLQGYTVVPGLIDAHVHFAGFGLRLTRVNLEGAPTLEEALERVADRVAASEPGEWIQGGGWNRNRWGDGSFPHRGDLDLVSLANPVVLSSKDGHSTWANTKALELAGVTSETPDPPGGHIRRDASGQPTGILQENAAALVRDVMPQPSLEQLVAACRLGQAHAHRLGLTGIHDCEDDRAFAAFQELRRQGQLSLRVLVHIPAREVDAALALGVRDGLGDPWLRIAGIKVFTDGALGSRSAWMLAPYETDPANTGIPTISEDELQELVRVANGAGLSVAIHAIGDAANRAALDALAGARDSAPNHLRNRIEHVQLLHPDDLPRLAELGVIASMQPIHATSDIEIADLHWGARAATGYAWRALLDAGTRLAFGSDAPVEDLSPLLGIHAAVTRRRADGSPSPDGWHPEQRVSVAEAVHAYTMGAAYASGEEELRGSLAPGKLADLTVLDQDIFRIDPMDIQHVQVLGTMVDGQFVYRSDRL
jgi:predicted amidohydrolase YtcJ